MTKPYTGGCACGAIRYSIAAEPVAMVDCQCRQCRQCQQESGTGHASHLVFPQAAATITGTATQWAMVGDGGTAKSRAFCPTCGSPVFMTFPKMAEVFTVRAASLDDPGRYKPQMITWAAAGQAWDHVDPAMPKFERMPPG